MWVVKTHSITTSFIFESQPQKSVSIIGERFPKLLFVGSTPKFFSRKLVVKPTKRVRVWVKKNQFRRITICCNGFFCF